MAVSSLRCSFKPFLGKVDYSVKIDNKTMNFSQKMIFIFNIFSSLPGTYSCNP